MYAYAIRLEDAIKRFPFLAHIKIEGDIEEIGPHQVVVTCWNRRLEKKELSQSK
jgi:hypothetical protein